MVSRRCCKKTPVDHVDFFVLIFCFFCIWLLYCRFLIIFLYSVTGKGQVVE